MANLEAPPKEELERLLVEKSKGDLARYYGVSRGTITRWCIFHGLLRNNDRMPTKEQLEECVDSGMKAKEIKAKYEISLSTISAMFTAYGIKNSRKRAEEAMRVKILSALDTPMPLGKISTSLGMEPSTLSAYLYNLKKSGQAAIVGKHEDGRGLWGIPEEPVNDEPVTIDMNMIAGNAPQYIGIIEHELQARAL